METIQKLHLKQKLDDIILEVSWAEISKYYFGNNSSWIYNRINGRDSNNGNPIEFTDSEKDDFKNALFDLADRIRKTAEKI